MSEQQVFLDRFLCFLRRAPTPYHAVRALTERLDAAGFTPLEEGARWQLQVGGRHYVVRNGSSLFAFALGSSDPVEQGIHLMGAHTDSPCLKVKPQPELLRNGFFQLGVEVYGGVLQNPWFDRDLSMAGRVTGVDGSGRLVSHLVDFEQPVAVIPSLAIHLDRGVNESRSINAQNHLPPVLMCAAPDSQHSFRAMLLAQLRRQQPDVELRELLDYEISLYDTQPAAQIGIDGEFIAGARLDNLLSCFVGIEALIAADDSHARAAVLTDHEEVGSSSLAGAQGTLMQAVLQRIAGSCEGSSHENYVRMLDRSLMISCDNAHGIHPNYADRHDGNHGPLLNGGPVIKVNANQRYATNSETAALFRHLCQLEQVPVQSFVVRSDMGCGSTIGPIAATELGVRTVDVGVPQWAMHSIRELAGSDDCWHLFRVLRRFFQFR
jgi:aspartyl aminopeptidase